MGERGVVNRGVTTNSEHLDQSIAVEYVLMFAGQLGTSQGRSDRMGIWIFWRGRKEPSRSWGLFVLGGGGGKLTNWRLSNDMMDMVDATNLE